MKNYLIIFFISFFLGANAQVGVNTTFPKGVFHVDGGKDNASFPTKAMQDNDFVGMTDGKIGIGILDPTVKIHISSVNFAQGFRLADGTQGTGKLLTVSNLQGDIQWADRISTKTISADGGGYNGQVNSDMKYINRKVTLEPGRWLIKSNVLILANTDGTVADGFYSRFSWAEYDGTNYFLTNDALSGNEIGGSYMLRFGIASGQTLINNNSSSSKTYYLVTRTPLFWGNYNQTTTWHGIGGNWGETSIIAFPAN